MSDFQISDYLLQRECEALAADIFADIVAEMADDETPEDYRAKMSDRAHEDAGGHQWVIYNHMALMLCAHCDTSNGDAFVDDVGINWTPGESTIYTVATALAYGEIKGRIEAALNELAEAWEDTRETAETAE